MQVTWKGDESREPSVEVFGTVFPHGEPVDIGRLPLDRQKKLVDNPHFEAADNDAKALAVAPSTVKEKKTDTPRASEFADIWNRLKAVEADNDTLRKAVSELSALPKRLGDLAARVDALEAELTAPKAEKPKAQK